MLTITDILEDSDGVWCFLSYDGKHVGYFDFTYQNGYSASITKINGIIFSNFFEFYFTGIQERQTAIRATLQLIEAAKRKYGAK